MRKFTLILLAAVLMVSSMLAGCGCGKKDDTFGRPNTQAHIDHAQAIKQARMQI